MSYPALHCRGTPRIYEGETNMANISREEQGHETTTVASLEEENPFDVLVDEIIERYWY
jgi:hypothetical protein